MTTLLVFSSCDIEKKYHSPGYRIQWRNATAGETKSKPAALKTKVSLGEKSTESYPTILHSQLQTTPISYSNPGVSISKVPVIPPDTVIVYDTVFEEDVIVVPDSIKSEHERLLAKADALKKKRAVPYILGYLALSLGGSLFFYAALFTFIALGWGDSLLIPLIALGVSILLLLFGSLCIKRGLVLEGEIRKLNRRAKELIAPYLPPKPAPQKASPKKSKNRWLIYLAGAYFALRLAIALLL